MLTLPISIMTKAKKKNLNFYNTNSIILNKIKLSQVMLILQLGVNEKYYMYSTVNRDGYHKNYHKL